MVFIRLAFLLSVLNGCLLKEIPEYIRVCSRDQNTINSCVRDSIENIRPKLAEGIPELNVPSVEPFIIPEIRFENGNALQFEAVGKDVRVYGASNFTIRNLNVDLDTFTIKGRVRFPKLHLEGRYRVNGRLLILPLKGEGNIIADAVRCDADIELFSEEVETEGLTYINFTKLAVDARVKDYRIRLDGLFNGDKLLGEASNEAIHQNRAEFYMAMKPYLEEAASNILLNTANKIASTYPLQDLLPTS